ncbi:MAG: DUF4147 domain-containing protein [Acidobacteriota bacterium]|nr:DUF4147 domain-containing protein [Acidobacteriota bacterium]
MKRVLRDLFVSTLEALAPERVVPLRLIRDGGWLQVDARRVRLAGIERIRVLSVGKAAHNLVDATYALLCHENVSGMVVATAPPERPIPGVEVHIGSHPYPDAGSFAAAEAALRFATECTADDLALFLISGGGSSLVEKPISDAIGLEDCRAFYELLVTCGANIVDMNVLRKHLSSIKGGRLALAASPARQVTAYICDVPAEHPSAVASGPTMPDESSVADCRSIVDRLGLRGRLPQSIRDMFDSGAVPETPKPDDPAFARCSWHRLLGTEEALAELASRAGAHGWFVETDMSVDDWPVDDAIDHLLDRLDGLRSAHPGRTVALLTGGELSCPVTGDGRGGRNQVFVLRCATRIAGRNVAVMSAGTDGIDGNSASAGAVADGSTIDRATRLGLDPAECDRRSDSSTFFARLGDDLTTGPTGNNVRDLRVLVAW